MKKSIHILLAFCLLSTYSLGQNLACSALAYSLSVSNTCNTVTLGNTENGNNPGDAPSCGGTFEDIWVTVEGTGNPITITADNGNKDMAIAAYTSCIGGELDCAAIPTGGSGSITFPTTIGTTYMIQIQRTSGTTNGNAAATDLIFDICATDALLPDGGDDPCTATALPLSPDGCATYSAFSNANATTTVGPPAPGCGAYVGTDVWFTVTVPASGDIVINGYPLGMQDGDMAVYSGPDCNTLTLVECDDLDGIDLMPNINLTGRTPGETLWIRFWEFGGNYAGSFGICATEPPPPPTNSSCDSPDPICSGTPTVFNTSVTGQDAEDDIDPGNNYGCLGSSPDPTWYYLEISTAGDLSIQMAGSADIDFAIWGPFADVATAQANCESYGAPLDCSFSIASTEQADVAGVTVGQVYVMVVTNYAGTAQTITVSDAAGNTAGTDCTILGVAFKNFKGTKYNSYNLLSWETGFERNNEYFQVERSEDGEVFESIGEKIAGKGTYHNLSSYTAVDENPVNGLAYYRIKQVDFNGSTSYSEVISINRAITDLGEFEAYPNPFNDGIKVKFNLTEDQNVVLQFVNQVGKVVSTESFDCKKGTNKLDLNTLFEPGMYLLNVQSENGELNQTQRVVKK